MQPPGAAFSLRDTGGGEVFAADLLCFSAVAWLCRRAMALATCCCSPLKALVETLLVVPQAARQVVSSAAHSSAVVGRDAWSSAPESTRPAWRTGPGRYARVETEPV